MLQLLNDPRLPKEAKHSVMAAYNQLTFDHRFPDLWTQTDQLRQFLAGRQSVFLTSKYDRMRKFGSPAITPTLQATIQGLERAAIIETEDFSPLLNLAADKSPLSKLLFG